MKTVYRFGDVIRVDGDFVTVHFKSTEKELDFLEPNSHIKVGDKVCVKEKNGFSGVIEVYPDHTAEEMGKLVKNQLPSLMKAV